MLLWSAQMIFNGDLQLCELSQVEFKVYLVRLVDFATKMALRDPGLTNCVEVLVNTTCMQGGNCSMYSVTCTLKTCGKGRLVIFKEV